MARASESDSATRARERDYWIAVKYVLARQGASATGESHGFSRREYVIGVQLSNVIRSVIRPFDSVVL